MKYYFVNSYMILYDYMEVIDSTMNILYTEPRMNVGVKLMQPDKMLTVDEVADQLRVHPRTVRQWIAKGELIAFDTGRGFRIKPSDLEEFIRNRQNRPHERD